MAFTGVMIHGSTVGACAEMAQVAEEAGFDSAWVTEVNGPDLVTVLTSCANATSRMRLASGIAPTFVRDPFLAAMTFSALQDVSDGRAIAGFGTSTPAIVTGWHGLPWERPLGHTREYVDIFRRLTAGERVKHEGRFTLRGASLQYPPATPIPVYLGALNERMLELAGEIADGVILNFPSLSYTEWAMPIIERGLATSGRSRDEFEVVALFRTVVDAEYEAASLPVKQELLAYFMAPVYERVFRRDGYGDDCDAFVERWRGGDRQGAIVGISEQFVRSHAVLGSVEECRAQVQAYLDAGVDTAVLNPVSPAGAPSRETRLATIRALGGAGRP